MAELIIENLVKSFQTGARAINDVSLTLPSGRWLTLLGPSGCGKSTTLNCIAGLEAPDSGVIRLSNQVLFDQRRGSVPPEERDVGMVFQSRSEEHTSELQSLMRISYAVFCLKKKIK